MMRIPPPRLKDLFDGFASRTVLVVGDVMLDRYVWGRVSRISPEAPVPVVEIERESFMLGGAANVTHNVSALGAGVIPVGLVGPDPEGLAVKRLFEDLGFPADGLITDPERPTTMKTRILAHHQHVVRTDRETRTPISGEIETRIAAFIESKMGCLDAVILEDYNKGLLSPGLIGRIVRMAAAAGKPVFVDPKSDHFFEYRGVTLFKPNRKEASEQLGFDLKSEDSLRRALALLIERLDCGGALITLGEDGMVLQQNGGEFRKVPTRAKAVHDVSGAGDTVIATMAVAMAAGAGFEEAAVIANHAAGDVCGEVGVVPVNRARLLRNLLDEGG
ncbi:MAG: D-glycero-beta-D-manno-heptose-7-phosphate kinase [bacterium]|nr:D-glycero-beta-D-manno-heptose-7-phosphate kinase [bacterium]